MGTSKLMKMVSQIFHSGGIPGYILVLGVHGSHMAILYFSLDEVS